MELWIRSQDREVLTKVVDIYKHADTNEIWSKSSFGIKNCLGFYSTKERALEVLDEIQRILQPAIKAYTPLTESKEDYKNHCMKTELVGYETTYDIVALPTYVYEMPKE